MASPSPSPSRDRPSKTPAPARAGRPSLRCDSEARNSDGLTWCSHGQMKGQIVRRLRNDTCRSASSAPVRTPAGRRESLNGPTRGTVMAGAADWPAHTWEGPEKGPRGTLFQNKYPRKYSYCSAASPGKVPARRRWVQAATTRTFRASSPLRPGATVNSTVSPSARPWRSSPSIWEWCTKRSSPPSRAKNP
jgi:hypothetical protein